MHCHPTKMWHSGLLSIPGRHFIPGRLAKWHSGVRNGYGKTFVEDVGIKNKYLDLDLSIDRGQILCRPAIRATALNIPLSTSSAHPPHIHRSWPRAVSTRLSNLSTRSTDADSARERLAGTYKAKLADSTTIDNILSCGASAGGRPSTAVCKPRNLVWIGLPFHPSIARATQRAISAYVRTHAALLIDHVGHFSVGIAWRNALPSLMSICRLR